MIFEVVLTATVATAVLLWLCAFMLWWQGDREWTRLAGDAALWSLGVALLLAFRAA